MSDSIKSSYRFPNNYELAKDPAIEFAEWIRDHYQPLAPNKKDWCSVRDKSVVVTTSELYEQFRVSRVCGI